MKECIETGCSYSQFGGGYCKYHQFRRYMRGGDKHKRKTPAKSKKRQVDEKRYTEVCKELEAEERVKDSKGRIFCFFSGHEIVGQISWHHLRGRGENLKDRRYLVPTINKYHLDFHFMSYDKFRQYGWYEGWLTRLKLKDEQSYLKELRRAEKVNKLNPKLFEDEDEELF